MLFCLTVFIMGYLRRPRTEATLELNSDVPTTIQEDTPISTNGATSETSSNYGTNAPSNNAPTDVEQGPSGGEIASVADEFALNFGLRLLVEALLHACVIQ